MKWNKLLIFIHIWILNPILNLYPFFQIDIFYDNQSHIGNALHQPLYLLLWAASSAAGFWYLSIQIWKNKHYPFSMSLHSLLCTGMFISCIIPYVKEGPVWLNDLHVWIAILCVGGFIAEWCKVFWYRSLYSFFEKSLLLIFIFCAFLLLAPGHITSSAEISFSFLVNANLYLLAFSGNHDKISS